MEVLPKSAALLFTISLVASCATHPSAKSSDIDLTGAWRSKVQFSSGAFAAIKDLEFMYAFNASGTMTESSNYDSVPPVPPAYGVWKRTGVREFEAIYVFYSTKPPGKLEDITGGGGWLPSGRGVLIEKIVIGPDGKHFKSTIRYDAFDQSGNSIEGGGKAEGAGERIGFSM